MLLNRMLLVATAVAVVVLAVYIFNPVLELMVLAFSMAYIGQPMITMLQNWGVGHTVASVLSLLLLLVVLVLCVGMAIPVIAAQFKQIALLLPQLEVWVDTTLVPLLLEWGVDLGSSKSDIGSLVEFLGSSFQSLGQTLLSYTSSLYRSGSALLLLMLKVALFPVVTFYLIREYKWLLNSAHDLLPVSVRPKIVPAVQECDEVLGGFVIGQLSMMGMLAFYYVVALWLCGIDQALSIGILIGMLTFIPFAGAAMGLVLVLVSTALQFGDWGHILLVLGVFVAGQLLENLLLTPWLVGSRLGLHPVSVLIGLLVAGHLFGFLGILLALPLTAIAVVALKHLVRIYKDSSYYA